MMNQPIIKYVFILINQLIHLLLMMMTTTMVRMMRMMRMCFRTQPQAQQMAGDLQNQAPKRTELGVEIPFLDDHHSRK